MRCSTIALISTCLTLTLGATEAWAEEAPTAAATAEELFRAGHLLLKQERYREACDKFAASQRADPASGTLLALAYCEERGGRLASAWQSYREAMALAATEPHPERLAAAQERAAALFPRLSTLTVKVPEPLPVEAELRVSRDGREIDPELWGRPVPVDGGRHLLEASAAGRKAWSFTVTVRSEGDHQTVTISQLRPEAAPIGVSIAPVDRAPATPASVPMPAPAADTGISARALNRTAWGLAIASVASLGIGATLAVVADSKNDRSNADGHCDDTGCDARGTDFRNSALAAARWATVSFAIGGVLAGSSVTLFLVADAKSSPSASTTPANRLARISGLGLSGKF